MSEFFIGANLLMGLPNGRFDGHAHVFRADLPMVPDRRYTPRGDAEPTALLENLRQSQLTGALLVQPSFLGADNSYLLESLSALSQKPGMEFRGVAVVTPAADADALQHLAAQGVVGLRLNLVAPKGAAKFSLDDWEPVLRQADALGFHIELHCRGSELKPVMLDVLRCVRRVVVDHFGLPDAQNPLSCDGHRAIVSQEAGRVLVKVSAPYRVAPSAERPEQTKPIARTLASLLDALGPDALLWGSDWPWTQFEGRWNYRETVDWRRRWEKIAAYRAKSVPRQNATTDRAPRFKRHLGTPKLLSALSAHRRPGR